MKKNKHRWKSRRVILLAASLSAVVLLAVYLGFSFYFKKHFFFRTEINGVRVGGMTVAEVEQKLADEVDQYILTVQDRADGKAFIKGTDLDCKYILDQSVSKLVTEQNAFAWPRFIFKLNATDMELSMDYNPEMLQAAIEKLPMLQEENMIEPKDAFIERGENGFEVVPEVMGTKVDQEKLLAVMQEAVEFGQTEVQLDDSVYINPQITTKSEVITKAKAELDKYLNTTIRYDIKGKKEALGPEEVKDLVLLSEDYSVHIDEAKVDAYVQKLASSCNTYGDERKFKTSAGDEIIIGGGDYGWIIDKEKEAQQIKEDILKGEAVTREPIYLQRAIVEGADDIGNTYLEIDYTNQHMWYYEKGKLVMDTDVVTGNISRKNGSPDGIFKIVYKKSPDVLDGEDYESNVTFFMPFAYNVGVHDADWRTEFGGELYLTEGSHGCINAPFEAAEKLYQEMKVGTPVIAYYREPVELTAENTKIANAYSYKAPKEDEE